MKKILISVLALMPMGANAITLQGCTSATCPTSTTAIVLDMIHPSCTSYTTKCLYNSSNNQYLRYRSCNSCSDPFEIETQKLSDELAYSSVCGTANFTTMTRNICTCGTQCDGCGALSVWGGNAIAYETRTVYSCGYATNCECKSSTEARCREGYYGSVTIAGVGVLNNCKRCPSSGGVYGTIAAGNGTAITSCYIPTTATLTDDTGAYGYTSNCYYTE